ncbi:hypothetical protein F4777DRAFT_582307 [Nemania sp. FL0916]|nr:hypothetical protein F4777DRAFT_582307 [Nemania sp. FL0916]
MDPFQKLPPELRLEILISTESKCSAVQLIRASPTMLRQYMAFKASIDSKLFHIDDELDNSMLNNAIAIIRYPGPDVDYTSLTWCEYKRLWICGLLASTWKEERTPINKKAIVMEAEISQLYDRLVVLAEDVVTQITAQLDSTEYSNAERRRFLRLFLKASLQYEMANRAFFWGILTRDTRRGLASGKLFTELWLDSCNRTRTLPTIDTLQAGRWTVGEN